MSTPPKWRNFPDVDTLLWVPPCKRLEPRHGWRITPERNCNFEENQCMCDGSQGSIPRPNFIGIYAQESAVGRWSNGYRHLTTQEWLVIGGIPRQQPTIPRLT
jgi:hypothetical protein